MKTFFIFSIQSVGRYLVVILNPGLAKNQIKAFLRVKYDNIEATNNLISFNLEVHENVAEIIQQIRKIYERSILNKKISSKTKIEKRV